MRGAAVLALALAACAMQPAGEQSAAVALAPLIGCWRGAFEGASDIYDERCFEVLSGEHVVDIHHVRPTAYSGETTYHYDEAAGEIVFAYSSNDGARSNGSLRVEDGAFVFPPHTHRDAGGAEQRLRSAWRFDGPDRFVTTTERFEQGAWRLFMRITYERTSAPD